MFDCHIEATISLSGAWIGEYISPSILASACCECDHDHRATA
jgi:hypothetical protein